MEKIDLGQTLTILANLGVIAGIFFLAIEVRDSASLARFSAIQKGDHSRHAKRKETES